MIYPFFCFSGSSSEQTAGGYRGRGRGMRGYPRGFPRGMMPPPGYFLARGMRPPPPGALRPGMRPPPPFAMRPGMRPPFRSGQSMMIENVCSKFTTQAIKLRVSWFQQCPRTSAPNGVHSTITLCLFSLVSHKQGYIEGLWKTPCLLKKPFSCLIPRQICPLKLH